MLRAILARSAPALLLFCCGFAHAELKLSHYFIDLHENQRVDALYASNDGDEVLYLKVEVAEILEPTSEQPIVRKEADPRALGLLVSPQRLVVRPGEEARVRLVALDKPAHDRFFKVSVVPTTGKLVPEQDVGVKVMIGYSAWVYVRPEGLRPKLTGRQIGGQLEVANDGGTLAQMMVGRQCDKGLCESIEPFRVLAGQTKRVELPMERGVTTFRMTWGDQAEDVSF